MVTAKKTVKKVVAKKAPPKAKVVTLPEVQYSMPMEVKEWIDQASSRMRHMKSEIDRLKDENMKLKSYRKFAEHRLLRSEEE
jgi:hypothetical protein